MGGGARQETGTPPWTVGCPTTSPSVSAGHSLSHAKRMPSCAENQKAWGVCLRLRRMCSLPRARDPCHAASSPTLFTHSHSLITPDQRNLAARLLVVLSLVTQAQRLHLPDMLVLVVSL